jgi:CheY-like chemotaxis protein
MARLFLVHWDPEDGRRRQQTLERLGHDVAFFPDLTGTPLVRALRAGGADAVLFDLTRRPSHAREIALALRTSKATRQTPLLFVDGDPEKVAALKAVLPDAAYTTWGRVRTAVPRAIRQAPAAPFVPPDALYAGRSLAQKLGIAAGERVAVLGAPKDFVTTLGALPPKVRLTAVCDTASDRVVWFVRSKVELRLAVGRLAATLERQVAWLAWPKRTSGVVSDLDGNVVRDAGLAAGLVDFKVCSIDATWSGLAFKRRRR